MKTIPSTLKLYLKELAKYPLLSPAEELELGRQIADGDLQAREKLINCNLRLVVYVAKNYKDTKLELEDLISAGNEGLIIAVDKYDYKLGYRFSTCAIPWIKQSIMKAITTQSRTIRIPAHIYQLLNKYNKYMEEHSSENKSDLDIAVALGITQDKLIELRNWKMRQTMVSFETPLGNEEEDTIGDIIPDGNGMGPVAYAEKNDLMNEIQKVLATLPERTAIILKMRYGIGGANDDPEWRREHTLEEIGEYLNLTRERVRQICNSALQQIKNSFPSLENFI